MNSSKYDPRSAGHSASSPESLEDTGTRHGDIPTPDNPSGPDLPDEPTVFVHPPWSDWRDNPESRDAMRQGLRSQELEALDHALAHGFDTRSLSEDEHSVPRRSSVPAAPSWTITELAEIPTGVGHDSVVVRRLDRSREHLIQISAWTWPDSTSKVVKAARWPALTIPDQAAMTLALVLGKAAPENQEIELRWMETGEAILIRMPWEAGVLVKDGFGEDEWESIEIWQLDAGGDRQAQAAIVTINAELAEALADAINERLGTHCEVNGR